MGDGLVIERLRVQIPAGVTGEFSSPELTLCADTYRCPFHPVLPQRHAKDPGHTAKSAGGKLYLNTHTALAKRSRSGLTMPLSRHNVGTYQQTSWNASCQETLGHSLLSLLSHCGLILAKRVELVCACLHHLQVATLTGKRRAIDM